MNDAPEEVKQVYAGDFNYYMVAENIEDFIIAGANDKTYTCCYMDGNINRSKMRLRFDYVISKMNCNHYQVVSETIQPINRVSYGAKEKMPSYESLPTGLQVTDPKPSLFQDKSWQASDHLAVIAHLQHG